MRDIVVEDIDAFGTRGKFYLKTVFDQVRTDEEGKPCYKDVPYVQISNPSDNKTKWDLPVKDKHKEMFPNGWSNFEAGTEGEAPGTPLEVWRTLPAARCKELQSAGFLAIEQIANCPDGKLGGIGQDGWNLRKEALAFLAPPDLATQALKEENKELSARLAALESEHRQLQNQNFGEPVQADQPKLKAKVGRKTNEERARLAAEAS